tara:strand:+ start:199 stop:525 length:327 start_codon:yes stop_codon:yes gene_type:complete
VDEALDTASVGGLQQHMCSQNIHLCEGERVSERVVNMGLRSEVHDRVDLVSLQDMAHKVGAADVAFHESVVLAILQGINVLEARRVVQAIEVDDIVLWILFDKSVNNV